MQGKLYEQVKGKYFKWWKKGSGDTSNASNETTGTTNTATTPANSTTNIDTSDNYIYGVRILAVLAIGVCVFFAYNTSQAANK